VGCIAAACRKGSYIGMFEFISNVVTIPSWCATPAAAESEGTVGAWA